MQPPQYALAFEAQLQLVLCVWAEEGARVYGAGEVAVEAGGGGHPGGDWGVVDSFVAKVPCWDVVQASLDHDRAADGIAEGLGDALRSGAQGCGVHVGEDRLEEFGDVGDASCGAGWLGGG